MIMTFLVNPDAFIIHDNDISVNLGQDYNN